MSEGNPRRRWLRFSLRTMFVLFVLFGLLCWVGLQFKWIHDRDRALQARPDFEYLSGEWETKEYGAPLAFQGPYPGKPVSWSPPVHAPWSIRIFGAEGVDKIVLPGKMEALEETRDEMLRLFPEAHIQVITKAVPINPRATQLPRATPKVVPSG